MDKKIGLIYSFNTKKSLEAAKKIGDEFSDLIQHVNAETLNKDEFMSFDKMILSVPTWFDGELPNYWDEFLPDLEETELKNKMFAIFGNGDQKGYPQNFVDGIGILAEIIEKRGGKIVGFTSAKDYSFENSLALRDDKFAGLALDFENQASQIDSKIKKWTDQLKKEFGIS